MNMWLDYYKERVGGEVIWNEGLGFIAYRIKGYECFIDEAYIVPSSRKKLEAAAMLKEVEEIALKEGCDHLSANVYLTTVNASDSLSACLGVGFKPIGAQGSVIVLRKELK